MMEDEGRLALERKTKGHAPNEEVRQAGSKARVSGRVGIAVSKTEGHEKNQKNARIHPLFTGSWRGKNHRLIRTCF